MHFLMGTAYLVYLTFLFSNALRAHSMLIASLKEAYEKEAILKELRKAKERTEEASRAKLQFLANVSHEIKTPLTAIKGFVETLQQGNVEKAREKERFLGIIQKHVDRLNAIIEDLLTLSRIEQEDERKEINFQQVKIEDVFQAAIQLCRPKAEDKKIRIDLDCEKGTTAVFDPTLIEQAVVNLLDNAIKYSEPEGTVQIKSHKTNSEVIINVQDHGIGIAQKHLPRLFERFYRVDKSRSRKEGGTGLGLAIVKHIAQAHSGHVAVESDIGEGSRFSIHLPQNK